jgi:uncharacterized membrane protein YhaH (DUF805 family)
MTFFEAIAVNFRKYAVFTGIAGRPEFWWFALFVNVVAAALNALNLVTPQGTIYLGSSLAACFGAAVLLPSLAVTVRRLRDCGRSWANLFWLLLPIAGLIVLIVLLAQRGATPPLAGGPVDTTVHA